MLDAGARPYLIAGREVHSSVSVGLVTGHGGPDTAETMIRNADVAMYEAKHAGKRRCVLFNDTMQLRLTRQLSIENALRAAVAHHDFESLHPFFDGNGRVGRLLLNIMLMQDGYPLALILRDWRQRYIKALQEASAGDYRAIIDLLQHAGFATIYEILGDRASQIHSYKTHNIRSFVATKPEFGIPRKFLPDLSAFKKHSRAESPEL